MKIVSGTGKHSQLPQAGDVIDLGGEPLSVFLPSSWFKSQVEKAKMVLMQHLYTCEKFETCRGWWVVEVGITKLSLCTQ